MKSEHKYTITLLSSSLAEYPKDKQFPSHSTSRYPGGVRDDPEPASAGAGVLGDADRLQHW